MSRASEAAKWLAFVLCDGPLPSTTGRAAWAQNGWPTDDERLLTASLRRAGIRPEHHGHPGTRQSWWWRAPGDIRPIGAEVRAHECNACRRILQLPEPRYCISTAKCPGHYVPTTLTPTHQPTHQSHHDTFTSIDLEAWRSTPSPLRNKPRSRTNARRTAPRWR
jgi:hypothetical protein